MSKNEEPDWLAELAKQLFEGAERIVRDARQSKTSHGPVPPFQQRLVRVADAAMQELLSAPEGAAVQVTAGLATSVATAHTPTVTFSGGVAMAPLGVSGQMTVEDHPKGFAAFSDGEKAAFILVWLYAIWLPWFASRLPPELHGLLADAVTNLAVALAISWRMLDKHK